MLTEVLKERDAQIDIKNAKRNWQKERDAKLYAQQEKVRVHIENYKRCSFLAFISLVILFFIL